MSAVPVPAEERRAALLAGRTALRRDFERGASPRRLLQAHSRLIDRTLRELWHDLHPVAAATLVATGGYGRGELYPHSTLWHAAAAAHAGRRSEAGRLVEQFIHRARALWAGDAAAGPADYARWVIAGLPIRREGVSAALDHLCGAAQSPAQPQRVTASG